MLVQTPVNLLQGEVGLGGLPSMLACFTANLAANKTFTVSGAFRKTVLNFRLAAWRSLLSLPILKYSS
jgi:hypothetical protein